ncbi:MAG: cobalamin-dependent protein [Pirellulales bacterium]|nr:cobalamin-dependent protein [Pirellulales bacterium]
MSIRKRKLRFLFIQPNFHRHYVTFFPVYEPLHGLLLGAVVEDLAETRIFDRRFDTDAALVRLLKEYQPDIVGGTTHTAGEVSTLVRLLDIVKKECPQTRTIVGGQHATLLPEDFYGPSVDLVCIGPGEETFREVVEAMVGGEDFESVAGLKVHKQDDHYVQTAPRDLRSGTFSWPKFNRSLIPSRYKRHYFQCFERRTTVYTITTSGCPFRCNFCSLWAAARGTFRRRLAAEIAADIACQPQPYVHLTDDNTFCDESHAIEIYEHLKAMGVKKKILAYARADTIVKKPDLLKLWKEVGLGALVVGMEGASNRHLKAMNKSSEVGLNIEAQRIMDDLDIENWAHFVVLPSFQREDFQEIWDFVEHLQITYPVFIPMTPVPGTPLFFEAKQQGQLSVFDYGFYNLQYMVMHTEMPKDLWYEELATLYRKSCSPRTLWRRRRSPGFHIRPAIGRAMSMGPVGWRIRPHIREQLELERNIRYEDIEARLPPSLRRDYAPVNYYHAPATMLKTNSNVVNNLTPATADAC